MNFRSYNKRTDYSLFTCYIHIIMWLVHWAPPMPVDLVVDDRQLPNQCWVEQHQIQLSGANFDEVGLICGSSPLAKRPHWTWGLDCGPMDGNLEKGQTKLIINRLSKGYL